MMVQHEFDIGDTVLLLPSYKVAVKVIRLYDDGYLTSVGFTREVYPSNGEPVMYNALAATELPLPWKHDKAGFIDGSGWMQVMASMREPDYVGYIKSVDFDKALELSKLDRPKRVKDRVFVADNNRRYSFVILNNNFV